MTTIYAIHGTDDEHLAAVQAEMETLGAPTIRVVDCGDHYMALEGSHRLAAAHALGIAPELVIYEQDDDLAIGEFDWYEPANWASDRYTAGEVAGELFAPSSARAYTF